MKTNIKAIAVKTLIASAIASAMGVASAQWIDNPLTQKDSTTVTDATKLNAAENNFFFRGDIKAGDFRPGQFFDNGGKDAKFTQNLWVEGNATGKETNTKPQAHGLVASDATMTNSGNIYVTATGTANSWSQSAMLAQNGGTIVNEGVIVAKNAYGMTVGSAGENNAMTNGLGAAIYVEGTGVGIELGGANGATASNEGLISVGAASSEEGAFTIAVQIKDTSNTTFTNEGTIDAANATNAIYLGKSEKGTTQSNSVILSDDSTVNGDIAVDTGVTQSTIQINTHAAVNGNVVLRGTNTSLNGSHEGSTINGDILAYGGSTTVGESLSANRLVLGIADNKDTEENEASQSSLSINGDLTVNTAEVTNGTLTVAAGQDFDVLKDVTIGKAGAIQLTKATGEDTSSLYIGGNLKAEANAIELNGNEIVTSLSNLLYTDDEGTKHSIFAAKDTGSIYLTDRVNYTLEDYADTKALFGGLELTYEEGTLRSADGKSYSIQEIREAKINNVGKSNVTFAFNAENDVAAGGVTDEFTFGSVTMSIDPAYEGTAFDKGISVGSNTTTGQVTIRGDVNGQMFIGLEDRLLNLKGDITLGDKADDIGHIDHAVKVLNNVTVQGQITANKNVALADNATLQVDEYASFTAKDGVDLSTGNTFTVGGDFTTSYLNGSLTTVSKIDGGVFAVLGTKPVTPPVADEGEEEGAGEEVAGEGTTKAAPDEEKPESVPSTPLVPATKHFANAVDFSNIDQIKFKVTEAGSRTTGGIISSGADAQTARAAVEAYYGDEADEHNVVYVAKQTNVGNGLWINYNQSAPSDQYTNNNADTLLVNLGSVAQTPEFIAEDGVFKGKVTFENGTTLAFTNLVQGATVLDEETGVRYVKLAEGVELSNGGAAVVDLGSQYYDSTNAITNERVYFNVDEERVDSLLGGLWFQPEFNAALQNVNVDSNRLLSQLAHAEFNEEAFREAFAQAHNVKADEITPFAPDGAATRAVPAELQQEYNEAAQAAYDNFYQQLTAEANTVANMAAAGGVYNVALDVIDQNDKALNRRMTVANSIVRAESGVTPWVDVFGTWNTADSLYGSSGYEADIYGAAFGADWTAPCGAILGAAVTIGTADANSVDAATKVDNDVDFYGFSIYGAHQVGNFNGKFSLGYMRTENDLSSSVIGERYDEDLDADAFTLGIGGEYLLSAGAFNVVPHVGLRYTRLSVDDLSIDVDNEDMDIFQMPIGVTVSGSFETAGMKVAPMFDLSFVPAFGDKDAVAKFGNSEEVTRVVDTTPVQATLGINAQVDAWTFGMHYELGVGGDDRMNNSFNLNARYTF